MAENLNSWKYLEEVFPYQISAKSIKLFKGYIWKYLFMALCKQYFILNENDRLGTAQQTYL
jgi:hypothetical protein